MISGRRPFVWGNEEFDTVEQVQDAIRAFLLDALGQGSSTDLSIVTRQTSFGSRGTVEYEARIVVFVEQKK